MTQYSVVLLDMNDKETANSLADNLTAARGQAKYYLSNDFVRYVETTHEDLQTEKVEIHNESGECLWGRFR